MLAFHAGCAGSNPAGSTAAILKKLSELEIEFLDPSVEITARLNLMVLTQHAVSVAQNLSVEFSGRCFAIPWSYCNKENSGELSGSLTSRLKGFERLRRTFLYR